MRLVSDRKVSEYRSSGTMVISMMLRYIHACLTGSKGKYGAFKLRGVEKQFLCATRLYHLITEHNGRPPESELVWSVHYMLDTLLRPIGLGTRPIDSPMDQALFIWCYVSNSRYRIAKEVASLIAGRKFVFRSTAIHVARVNSRDPQSKRSLYDGIQAEEKSDPHAQRRVVPTETLAIPQNPQPDETQLAPPPEVNKETLLQRLAKLKSRGMYVNSSIRGILSSLYYGL